jgi:CubicO group peptidase (beta-lactamase class C family)
MAGYVAEMAGGRRYGPQMEELVLRPAGMERSTFKPLVAMTMDFAQGHMGAPGQPATVVRPFTENTAQWGAGFLMSTASELARFAMVVMGQGTIEGREVLAPATVRRMTTGYVAVPGGAAQESRYGYGLVAGRRGPWATLQHGGGINGFQANVVMVPERGFAVIVLTNRSGSQLGPVVEAAARLALGELPPQPTPPASRPLDAAERRALAGAYGIGQLQLELIDRDGGMVLRQGTAEILILGYGTDQIGFTPPGQTAPTLLTTVPGPDGRVAYLSQGSRAVPRREP